MRAGIHEDALQVMIEGGAVREVLVSRHGDKWGLAIRGAAPAVAGCRCARGVKRCAPGPA